MTKLCRIRRELVSVTPKVKCTRPPISSCHNDCVSDEHTVFQTAAVRNQRNDSTRNCDQTAISVATANKYSMQVAGDRFVWWAVVPQVPLMAQRRRELVDEINRSQFAAVLETRKGVIISTNLVKSLSYDIYAMEQKQGMTTAQEKRNSDPEKVALLLAAFHKAGKISST